METYCKLPNQKKRAGRATCLFFWFGNLQYFSKTRRTYAFSFQPSLSRLRPVASSLRGSNPNPKPPIQTANGQPGRRVPKTTHRGTLARTPFQHRCPFRGNKWVSLVDVQKPPGKPGIAIYFSNKRTKNDTYAFQRNPRLRVKPVSP